MAKDPPKKRDSVAAEVDRLLRKLPGADPTLGGGTATPGPAAGTPRPAGPTTGPRAPSGAGKAPFRSTAKERGLVWIIVLLGVAFSIAMTQWPYAHVCGIPLFGYLLAVMALMLIGGWGAIGTWRHRIALAHIVSLIVVFWGIVLAAEQVLPRVGYAGQQATWFCPQRSP